MWRWVKLPDQAFLGCARQQGAALIPLVMVLVLLISVAVIYVNRPLIAEQRAATNVYHEARAGQAAAAGLAWTLASLNGSPTGAHVCGASALRRWAMEESVKQALRPVACELTAQGPLACDCERDEARDLNRLGVGFQVTLARVAEALAHTADSAMWDVAVVGCSAPAGRGAASCAAADGATVTSLGTRLRFVPLLARLPSAALTAGGTISAPLPTGAGEPAWGGYVMGAYLSTPSQEVAAEPSPTQLTGARAASPRDNVPAVGLDAFRDVAFRLTCDGDCSGPIHRAVQLGHTVIWVDGDLALAPDLTLGDDGHPVLLWVTGDVTLSSEVSVTGLLMSRSVVWRVSPGREAHFKGAMVVDGSITVTGSPSIEWAPEVLDRLASTSGWFEPVPRSPKVN